MTSRIDIVSALVVTDVAAKAAAVEIFAQNEDRSTRGQAALVQIGGDCQIKLPEILRGMTGIDTPSSVVEQITSVNIFNRQAVLSV